MSAETSSGDRARLAQQMLGNLGPAAVMLGPAERAAFALGGGPPWGVVAPSSAEEACAVVDTANKAGVRLVPWGAGTKQAMGDYAVNEALVLSLGRMSRILEVDSGNQTVRVEGGVRLRALDEALGRKGLWLPLDPEDWAEATVGGTIAANASGPRRLRYGTVRDFLLGVKVVMPTGEIAQAGGKTVKDVAGYDLKKLAVGAWGTLGIIVEATLRLLPRPAAAATAVYHFGDGEDAARFGEALLCAQLLPCALEVLDRHAGRAFAGASGNAPAPFPRREGGADTLVLVALEGTAQDVAFQRAATEEMARHAGGRALPEEAVERRWAARRQVRRALGAQWPEALWLKAMVPISQVGATLRAAREVEERRGVPVAALAHAGNGIVYLTMPLPAADQREGPLEALEQLAGAVGAAGGLLVVERGPREARERAQAPARRGDLRLMRALKAALDPNDVLNPGRLAWIGL